MRLDDDCQGCDVGDEDVSHLTGLSVAEDESLELESNDYGGASQKLNVFFRGHQISTYVEGRYGPHMVVTDHVHQGSTCVISIHWPVH